jgi:oligopeptide/dipeptide ABC transporter ATP-binding protein
LQAAVPIADPRLEAPTRGSVVAGEVPDAANPPAGCRFHPRCPLVEDVCRRDEPELMPPSAGYRLACHVMQRDLAEPATTTSGGGR